MNIYSPYIYGAFTQSGSTSYIREDLGVGLVSGIHPSAKLEVSGTTKGVLFPRMTESQKNAITTPATSLLVYQTDGTAGYYYYNGSSWINLGGGSVSLTGYVTTNTSQTVTGTKTFTELIKSSKSNSSTFPTDSGGYYNIGGTNLGNYDIFEFYSFDGTNNDGFGSTYVSADAETGFNVRNYSIDNLYQGVLNVSSSSTLLRQIFNGNYTSVILNGNTRKIIIEGTQNKFAALGTSAITGTQNFEFPNNSGTIALLSDITALTDVRVTGGTYNAGTATFTNNTGGTFNVTGFSTATGNITGSGTANYIPKFTGATGISNSNIYDDGTNVGIGSTSPLYKLQVESNVFTQALIKGTETTRTGELYVLNSADKGININVTGPTYASGAQNEVRLSPVGAGMQSISIGASRGAGIPTLMANVSTTYVGISTTGATQKLDVNGNIKIANNNSLMWRNAANNADIAIMQLTNTNQLNIGTTSSSVPSIIALHTNSAERLRVSSTGNVGIGTTNPLFKLHAYQSGLNFSASFDGDSLGGFVLKTTGTTGQAIYNSTGNHLSFYDIGAAQTRLFIQNGNGFVHIGGTTPNALLDVNGDALINTVSIGLGGSNINTNTILGNKSLFSNVNGSENLAVGFNSLGKNTDGSGNVAMGFNSMFNNDNGNSNVAIGAYSMFKGVSNRGSVAVGVNSLYNVEGRGNLAIGSNAAFSLTNGDNNNIIGNENDYTPTQSSLNTERNILSISKNNDNVVGLPQIWSPDQTMIGASSISKILEIDSNVYAAVFVDYVILDNNSSSRAGTLKCVFDATRTSIKWDETATGDIGTTADYLFDFKDNGIYLEMALINNSTSYDVYINYTTRLILKPII